MFTLVGKLSDLIKVVRGQGASSHLSSPDMFWISGVSKAVATLLTYPLIRAKAVIQTTGGNHLGLWGMLAQIVRQSGWLGLYQGVWIMSYKTVLFNSLMMALKQKVSLALMRWDQFRDRRRRRQAAELEGFRGSVTACCSLEMPWEASARGASVVYVDGSWCFLHDAQAHILREAHQQADHLIVGVHSDECHQVAVGSWPPECYAARLGRLRRKPWAASILEQAPWEVTPELLDELGITTVVSGSVSKIEDCSGKDVPTRPRSHSTPTSKDRQEVLVPLASPVDPYAECRRRGIFEELPSLNASTEHDEWMRKVMKIAFSNVDASIDWRILVSDDRRARFGSNPGYRDEVEGPVRRQRLEIMPASNGNVPAGMESASLIMRNFPKSWMDNKGGDIDSKLRKLLGTFGQLSRLQVIASPGAVTTATATFAETAMAEKAVKALHGVDMRTAKQKREAGNRPPAEEEKFWAQIVAKVVGEEQVSNERTAQETYLLVEGFPTSWSEAQLRATFLAFGGVERLTYVPDSRYGRVARLVLKEPEEMSRVVKELHGTTVGDGDVVEECVLNCKVTSAAVQKKEEEARKRREEKEARKLYRADVRKRREEARREKEKVEKDGSEHPDETQHEEKVAARFEAEEREREELRRKEAEEAEQKKAEEEEAKKAAAAAYQEELRQKAKEAAERREKEQREREVERQKREEKRRLWELDRMKREEERQRREDKRQKAEEERLRREEEERQRRAEARAEAERKREEERQRKEEKMRKYEESRMRREEVRTRNEIQRELWEDECMKREEKLQRWAEEQMRIAAEKKRKLEEERRRKHEEEIRKWEEKRMRREEEMQRRAEKAAKQAAERKRQREEEKARLREEERQRREEEFRKYEESRMKREEELQRWFMKVLEARDAAEQRKQVREEERKRKEEKMRRWEEDRMAREETRQRREEKRRVREEERHRKEEHRKKKRHKPDGDGDAWKEADVAGWAAASVGEDPHQVFPSARPKQRAKRGPSPPLEPDDETDLDRLLAGTFVEAPKVQGRSKALAKPAQRLLPPSEEQETELDRLCASSPEAGAPRTRPKQRAKPPPVSRDGDDTEPPSEDDATEPPSDEDAKEAEELEPTSMVDTEAPAGHPVRLGEFPFYASERVFEVRSVGVMI
ncbi:unnamed protein product [Symbiodinium sp. CCMP2592]|nr:unnamed protein product [Symbiodinium sp. CCMP2592]